MFLPADKLHAYFSGEFPIKKGSNGWFDFKCPMCNELEHRKKMAVNFKYGWVKCWVCGFNDSAVNFIMEHEGISLMDAKAKIMNASTFGVEFHDLEDTADGITLSELEMPYSYKSLGEGTGLMAGRANRYLEKRGFNLKELDRMGFGYCNMQPTDETIEDFFGYIIIPFRSNGKLVYYIGRDFLDRGEYCRYKNPKTEVVNVGKGDLFFNEDALNIYGEVFLTEGWADASTMGRNGISSQGWSLSQRQKTTIISSACDRIVMIPDLGEDGTGRTFYSKAIETAIDYLDYKEMVVLDLSPLMTDKKKDVNDFGRQAVLDLYKNTEPLTYGKAMDILLT